MQPNVLITASTYSHICNFHLPYIYKFRELGYKVHVACGGKEMDIPDADAVFHLPFEKKMSAPGNFRAAAMLRGQIKRENYALVMTHTSLAAFFTRLAVLGMKKRPKVVNVAHGYLFGEESSALKTGVLLGAERLTAPVTDLLLTMNRWDYETACQNRLGAQVVNIPGIGVDFSRLDGVTGEDGAALRREFGIPGDAFVLICAAEFSARKNQSVLIRAMEQLPERVRLILAGSGAMLDECRRLAAELGVTERVLFPGYIQDMPRWYAMADAAVTASRSEGLPFNVMEAMYARLPVVASAVKGHEDLIIKDETGLLYPCGDHEECARQVQRLLDDPALRAELTLRARESVLQYRLERVLPLVMAEYEDVLAAKVSF